MLEYLVKRSSTRETVSREFKIVMCKSKYAIRVAGERVDREKIAGCIVLNASNLVSGVGNYSGSEMFYFRYHGDARLVLKRITKSLSIKAKGNTLLFGSASATIQRLS